MKPLILILLLSNVSCASIPGHKPHAVKAGPTPTPPPRKIAMPSPAPKIVVNFTENYFCSGKK